MAELINTQPKEAGFVRLDGHSIELGLVVCYRLPPFPFQIQASRLGVTVQGTFPTVKREGVQHLTDMIWRALRHHEHLAWFPVGTKQEALNEEILEAEEAAAMLIANGSLKTM